MHLVVMGLNHETAPIHLREKFRIPEARLAAALDDLSARPGVHECLLLATCNRTEVYACTRNRADDATLRQWFGEFFGLQSDEYNEHLYARAGHKAAEHLFRVSAGINSLVIGEAQILGQVKCAYAIASQTDCTGAVLNPLFQQALTVGKRARSETEIGHGAFSVSSVAVQLAKSIFADLQGRTVLIVGASKMGELTLTHLAATGVTSVWVTNRTYARAEELAAAFGGKPIAFEQLGTALATVDIVITATGADESIITGSMVAAAMRARRGRPIFCIDIAVPRNIAPDVSALDNVFVYNIDDLQSVVQADVANRQAEVVKIEAIIAEEVRQFTRWYKALDAIPVIAALQDRFERIRQAELTRLQNKLRHLSPEDLALIDLTTRSMINKLSHQPLVQIKEYAAQDDATARLETVCHLFGLCVDNDAPPEPTVLPEHAERDCGT